ncbi:MAG: Transposase DDE domain protein [Candidatus Diapherotrites archaeon ADurb.Bin253]|nr:MAG: Transposase DDE domain protein [Candidatus Diapherotrites archaeon ADurb.Bin253]
MRAVIGARALARGGAGETTVGRFEKEILLGGDNLRNLGGISMQWAEKMDTVRGEKEIILDIDSSESPVYGEQEGATYNGHFGMKCYHSLFLFNSHGDCLKAKLRLGNVHSTEGWREFLEPVLRHYFEKGVSVKMRGDAAFATPELYGLCEEMGIDYAIRIKDNGKLNKHVEQYMKRPVGRPGKKSIIKYISFQYRAGSWDKERRVVAKIKHHQGELFPRIGYKVTSMKGNKKSVVKFYNRRGTCEQWIKEGKYTLNWTRLSCQGFKKNKVRLNLFIMAHNLEKIYLTLALLETKKSWSLRTI